MAVGVRVRVRVTVMVRVGVMTWHQVGSSWSSCRLLVSCTLGMFRHAESGRMYLAQLILFVLCVQ